MGVRHFTTREVGILQDGAERAIRESIDAKSVIESDQSRRD